MSSSHWISRSALHRVEVKQDPAPLPYLQEEHLGWALGCHIRLELKAYNGQLPRNYSSYDIKLAVDLHTPSAGPSAPI